MLCLIIQQTVFYQLNICMGHFRLMCSSRSTSFGNIPKWCRSSITRSRHWLLWFWMTCNNIHSASCHIDALADHYNSICNIKVHWSSPEPPITRIEERPFSSNNDWSNLLRKRRGLVLYPGRRVQAFYHKISCGCVFIYLRRHFVSTSSA